MTEELNRQAVALAAMERLESDLRVLSPVGIERVGWGWDVHEKDNLVAFHAAERSALQAIDSAGQIEAWDQWRRRLFYEVEGRLALVAWRAEHQQHAEHAHKAERSAVGAALGVFARPWISHKDYTTLVSAMAEALPWLLPERPPRPSSGD
ncbi:MAG: hypothetical protein LC797_01545 [Chloroflexi bacterium]|nr:hypothetical protein [Chloroflexota bacterium]